MGELEDLRAELDTIDEELVDLAARRLGVVSRIGAVKASSDKALFDRERERVVLERARRRAAARGIPEEVGEALVHTLVEASHLVQVRHLATTPTPRRVLLIGGRGEMGRLFDRVLTARGHTVDVLEKTDGRDRAEAVRSADVVVVTVSMDAAVPVAREVAPWVRPDALLCDLNSLKVDICTVYEGMAGEGLGLHPMFGGTVASLRRQKIVACPVRRGPLTDWLLGEFGALGAEIVETTPERHDRMMAVVQVLLHFRTIVMGEAFRRAGVGIDESLRFTSPIYRLEMGVVARLFAQDPDLYASILLDNPDGAEMRAHFLDAAKAVEDVVSRHDREGFRKMFEDVRTAFGGFSEEAMRTSDALIDYLVSRA